MSYWEAQDLDPANEPLQEPVGYAREPVDNGRDSAIKVDTNADNSE